MRSVHETEGGWAAWKRSGFERHAALMEGFKVVYECRDAAL